MKKEDIIDEFKGQYDDFTVKVLARYVEEFDMCFGKYLPSEEVIKRLKNRIKHNIEIIDEYIYGNTDGQYDVNDEKIRLHKDVLENEEYCTYLTFHELTHAITTKDLPNGKMMGFSYIKNQYGTGLNESMTEWLTKIRNEKMKTQGLSNYETIVEQMRHLAYIVGTEKILECFFYEPENLKKVLEEKGMNYDEVENAFYRFIGNDEDVQSLVGGHEKPKKFRNYDLYREAEVLFDNFSNALGEVDSIKDFVRKYTILGNYINPKFNLNDIMEYHYYTQINKDINILLKKEVSPQIIDQAANGLRIDNYKYNLCNKIKQELPEDSTGAAKYLYRLYCNNPNQYNDFVRTNASWLFDRFSETYQRPSEKCIFNIYKYVIMGKFLSEHSEYEYEEISTRKYMTTENLGIYYFETEDKKNYVYTSDKCPIEKIENSKFRIIDGDTQIELDFSENSYTTNTKSDKKVEVYNEYSEYSQLSDLRYCLEDETLDEKTKEIYRIKKDKIKEKIKQKNRSI